MKAIASQKRRYFLFAALLFVVTTLFRTPASAQFTLQQISVDNFSNSDSVHKTEVEPATFSWGSTIVSAFHVARRPGSIGWGSADVGFSTSTDGGKTWTYGNLPGLTKNYEGGTYGAAADPSVAYDAKHGVWLISSLPLVGLNGESQYIGDVAVSRSTDGLHWGNPINIDKTHLDDKNWTVCDNTTTSPYYGNCYTEWDQAYGTGDVLMSVSSDGGQTWGPGLPSADHAGGLGGQPLVQPNGTVIVPFSAGNVYSFSSTNGGQSWGSSVLVSNVEASGDAGNIRNPDLPSAEIDAAGNVYVVWNDCRFRKNCYANDIVMSTSADGKTWTKPARIPLDPVTSKYDHFIPGIGIDHSTSGTTAHITIVLYGYSNYNCNTSTCKLYVAFTTSQDGGNTWTTGKILAGPMQLLWLPLSDNGYMVADYIHVSYANGNPYGVFPVAKAPTGSVLNEAMYTTKEPLLLPGDTERFSSQYDRQVVFSGHTPKAFYDDDGELPIPASRLAKLPR